MNKTLFVLLLFLSGICYSCSETEVTDSDYADWPQRNAAFFGSQLSAARAAIGEAKERYGDEWEAHCPWRVYRTYTLPESAPAAQADSVVVRIIEQGTGSGSPLYTDSVRINYIGRLMPTESHPEGKIFDHSGRMNRPEDVFSPQFSSPAAMLVSNTVEGFCTALMHMRIGDRWQVYIPQEMGYGVSELNSIPGSSTLVFDLQLKAYFHAGAESTQR